MHRRKTEAKDRAQALAGCPPVKESGRNKAACNSKKSRRTNASDNGKKIMDAGRKATNEGLEFWLTKSLIKCLNNRTL
jgi:hypothetical protein